MKSQLQAKTGLYIAVEWTDLLVMATRHGHETLYAIAMFHQT